MENNIPEKFLNEDGTLNAESLLKSYGELEKKIGCMVNVPADGSDILAREKFNRAIGVPESPDAYPDNPMFADMPAVREKFREIGLTVKQAESISKMAEELLMPAISEIMASRHESESMAELRRFFGGDEKMQAAMIEINNFAEKNLPSAACESLCSSADGIKTIYNMMKPGEPAVASNGTTGERLSDSELRRMMKDPKYWRDHDPEFVRKIETGFKKLYA